MRIFKYRLNAPAEAKGSASTDVDLTAGAKILGVHTGSDGTPRLIVAVDPDAQTVETRRFAVVATGGDVPEAPGFGAYVGTINLGFSASLVHAFDLGPSEFLPAAEAVEVPAGEEVEA